MEEGKQNAGTQQMVSFKLGNEVFGVNILRVQEIMRLTEVTRVPQTPDFMEGVINQRGNVIPIIDLRKKFCMEAKEADSFSRIVVVNVDGKVIGVIVDGVEEVLRLSRDQIEAPPDVGVGAVREYLMEVGKLENSLLILLHLDKILTAEEHLELENFDQIKKAVNKKAAEKKDTNKKKEEAA